MQKIAITALLFTVLASSGCATALYSNVTGPMQAMNKRIGPKKGKACQKNYLGLVAVGDGGIAAAAKEGGIREVTSVDIHNTQILGIYGERCTVVTGI